MSRVAFLVNPASDNGKTGKLWPELAHRAADLGLVGEALLSEHPGQLPELAVRAGEDGAEVVIAVGGDGTVNEVVNGLMRLRELGRAVPELAIVPRGTGRDFVRTFGIPRRLDEALALVEGGRSRARSTSAGSSSERGTAATASRTSRTWRARG